MVFYNFFTTDTNESPYIAFEVSMIDNKGNRWIEHNYDGCGMFGNKDIFVLIAEMNASSIRKTATKREEGMRLFLNKNNDTIFPNLIRYYYDKMEWQNVSLQSNKQQYSNDDSEEDSDENDEKDRTESKSENSDDN